MAYVKQTWVEDEEITKEKLDHIEDGIANVETIKGEKGATGANGVDGTRGSRFWSSNNVTGTSTTGTIFANSGISGALVYDYCIHKDTGNVYVCSKGGNADVAEWKYDSNIKGAKGDKGDTGAKGADATINKLLKIDTLVGESELSAVITSYNSLITDLKAKGFMVNS